MTTNWSDLAYVLAVARQGTLAAAAARLDVDQTTVGRRIQALQSALGSRLFDRIDRRWVPTPAAKLAILRAEAMEREFSSLLAEVSGIDQSLAGSVRLTSVPALINHVLAPNSGQLLTRYPALRLELVSSPNNLSLTHREADLALRLGRPKSGIMLARRIGTVWYGPYRARANAAKAKVRRWVAFDDTMCELPEARWLAREIGASDAVAVTVTDYESARAVIANSGCVGLLPLFLADSDRSLARVDANSAPVSRELWMLCHRAIRHTARITAVVGWIEEVVTRVLGNGK